MYSAEMAINNLHLLGDYFIQTGHLIKQWNVSEKMPTVNTAGGARGFGSATSKRRRTARPRTAGARGLVSPRT